jgi:hypothetical protein
MSKAKGEHECQHCKGEGWYYRLPVGMNPFASSIEVTARNMRRIKCDCTVQQQADR